MTHRQARLLPAVVAVVALLLFAFLAREVAAGSTVAKFDRSVATGLDERVTPEWLSVFRTITLLGTGWALGIASGVVGAGLLMRRHFSLAIGWIVAQVGAVVFVKLVKAVVQRDRPGLGDIEFYAHGWSFPSGHVVRTLVFCGMAAYLVHRLSGSRVATAIAGVVGLAWSITMAFSRLYLGAHFPSDVIGGLLLATAWVAICISAIDAARKGAAIEVERA